MNTIPFPVFCSPSLSPLMTTPTPIIIGPSPLPPGSSLGADFTTNDRSFSPTPIPIPVKPDSSLSIAFSILQSATTQITTSLHHQEITPTCAESLRALIWSAQACLSEQERCHQIERQSIDLIHAAQRLILEENARLRAQTEELKGKLEAVENKDDEQPEVHPDDSISCASSSSISSVAPSLFVSCEASDVGSPARSRVSKSDSSSILSEGPSSEQVKEWVERYSPRSSPRDP
ncbi:hypothetical protein ONZ45_g8950 [Pleurotus djamor]|nr:hypothetical protein ONZ45_g8950 [Pleurotus djamor]